MAVKKNPDFSVWLADVWHWARQPPGIYICIIVLFGAALSYSFSGPTTRVAWSPPPQPAPAYKPQPQPVAPPASCSPGKIYEALVGGCVGIVAGTQNNCPRDYIFIKAYNACTPLSVGPGKWYFEPGELVTLSGLHRTTITINQGNAVLIDDFTHGEHFLKMGDTITTFQAGTFEAISFTRIRITFQ